MHAFLVYIAPWLGAYAALASLLALVSMGVDKSRSRKRGARRIPERTLFLLAILGGSPGAVAGMLLFRHKTRHWYFRFGLPLILLLQLGAVIWLYRV